MNFRFTSRGSAIFAVGAVAVGWELTAYFSSPRSTHPTLSVIADEVMSVRPGRALVFALWLALGWGARPRFATGASVTSRTATFAGYAAILALIVVGRS